MAAIEKVCEYSGEYGGPEMYTWKKNSIQISPKYRKLFKGCKCELVFDNTETYVTNKYDFLLPIKDADYYIEKFVDWTREDEITYLLKYHNFNRLVQKWEYTLIVYDERLWGEVGGLYKNTTLDRGAVIRKMKRLVGDSNLKITYTK